MSPAACRRLLLDPQRLPLALRRLRVGRTERGSGIQVLPLGTWEDNDGVLPLDNERKLVTRGNFGFNLFDNVRIDWNTMYGKTDLSNTPAGNNAHGLVLNENRAARNYRNSSDPRWTD